MVDWNFSDAIGKAFSSIKTLYDTGEEWRKDFFTSEFQPQMPEEFDAARAAREFAKPFEQTLDDNGMACKQIVDHMHDATAMLGKMRYWTETVPANAPGHPTQNPAAYRAAEEVFENLSRRHPDALSSWADHLSNDWDCTSAASEEALDRQTADLVSILTGKSLADNVFPHWSGQVTARTRLLDALDNAVSQEMPGAVQKRDVFLASALASLRASANVDRPDAFAQLLDRAGPDVAIEVLGDTAMADTMKVLMRDISADLATRSPQDLTKILSHAGVVENLAAGRSARLMTLVNRIGAMELAALEKMVDIVYPQGKQPAPAVVTTALQQIQSDDTPANRARLQNMLSIAVGALEADPWIGTRELVGAIGAAGPQVFGEMFSSLTLPEKQVVLRSMDYAGLSRTPSPWTHQDVLDFVTSQPFLAAIDQSPKEDQRQTALALSTVHLPLAQGLAFPLGETEPYLRHEIEVKGMVGKALDMIQNAPTDVVAHAKQLQSVGSLLGALDLQARERNAVLWEIGAKLSQSRAPNTAFDAAMLTQSLPAAGEDRETLAHALSQYSNFNQDTYKAYLTALRSPQLVEVLSRGTQPTADANTPGNVP